MATPGGGECFVWPFTSVITSELLQLCCPFISLAIQIPLHIKTQFRSVLT